MKQENKQGVSRIIYKPTSTCFCPLGNDWYTNKFFIIMKPSDCFPDYIDIEKFINLYINGASLIIEDATKMLYDYIVREYNPLEVKVISKVDEVQSHSPVVVVIE